SPLLSLSLLPSLLIYTLFPYTTLFRSNLFCLRSHRSSSFNSCCLADTSHRWLLCTPAELSRWPAGVQSLLGSTAKRPVIRLLLCDFGGAHCTAAVAIRLGTQRSCVRRLLGIFAAANLPRGGGTVLLLQHC